jgi:hypothetical protein
MPHGSSATYGGMTCSVVELMVVLENLTFGGHRGKSCACLGAALRVVVWELLIWSSSVRRLEGWADRRPEAVQRRAWRCPVVLGPHNTRVMLQCQGWPEMMEETRLAGLTSRCRSRRVRSRWSYAF